MPLNAEHTESTQRGRDAARTVIGDIHAVISRGRAEVEGDPTAVAAFSTLLLRRLVGAHSVHGTVAAERPLDQEESELRRAALRELHDAGLTWNEIGTIIGTDRRRAESLANADRDRASRRALKKRRTNSPHSDDASWAA